MDRVPSVGEVGLGMETRFRGEQACAFSAVLKFCLSFPVWLAQEAEPLGVRAEARLRSC
ncbi:hypothetical protein D623_10013740 [Myotis brandtii]|uniref:Uncharacterized protein n=1 Tax=Myotis brandtii TaxID=109478 RepID=S7NJC1_MYOBR|nr:hypothetical protein D623_10013740 [Myotis brandtii]